MDFGDLSREDLMALKEVRLTGRLSDQRVVARLIDDAVLIKSQEGALELTHLGKRLLVRGSPALWGLL